LDSIREIKTREKLVRVGVHSHITGLGLVNGKALPKAAGMIGQTKAREAAGIVVEMIKMGKMAGRIVLLAGPPGTGKSAIAWAISKELGKDVPFVSLSGSEIYSSTMKKTEVLMQSMRKAIAVRLHEIRRVFEGEVKNIEIRTARNPYNPYQEIPESAKLTLSTKEETKTFQVGTSITAQLLNYGIRVGDVIQIDAESGKVVKLGRSEMASEKYEIAGYDEKPVPVPSGKIEKEKEIIIPVTLHDLDESMSQRGSGLFSIFFGEIGGKEISEEDRARVDEFVKKKVDEGMAEVIPGVLFIDEVHMLDIESFSFINRAMESELAPIIIFASNRGMTKIRGTDIESPHGMPLDLLDRLLIIQTKPYERDEIKSIIEVRTKEESVELSPEALEELTNVGLSSSLRYAVHLITPCYIIAKRKGKQRVEADDVKDAIELFVDLKTSIKTLKEYEELYMK